METNGKHIPINCWAEDDRPREKLLLKGRHSLSNAELIAILLGTGNRNESAVDLAKNVLRASGNNLVNMSKMSVQELMKIAGIGKVKAIVLTAAMELGRRRREEEVLQRKKISHSKDVFELLQGKIGENRYEGFWILLLDRANKIITTRQISEGGIAGTVADPKKIFKIAVDMQASSIILCHNHPSGNVEPSEADIMLTRKLRDASRLLDIQILDHLIIGEEKYFSFADENRL